MEEIREKFCELQTRTDVAELLGIEEKSLRYFLYGIRPDNMYHEFTIDKKTGGKRIICAPDKRLKNI
ncbi:MAG: serine protease, partial [Acetatifactor sp.]|nr:serine protease [Acetatifactor sp.]